MSRTQFFKSGKRPVRVPSIIRHSQDQELNLKLIPHGHLQAIVEGRGAIDEFLTVAFRITVGASLTGLANEDGQKHLNEVFLCALHSLILVGERYERLGKFGCHGDELTSLKAALNLTDDLQSVSTKRQQAEMYRRVQGFIGGFDVTMTYLRKSKESHSDDHSKNDCR